MSIIEASSSNAPSKVIAVACFAIAFKLIFYKSHLNKEIICRFGPSFRA